MRGDLRTIGLLLLVLCAPAFAAQHDTDVEKQARQAAESWLELVDSGRYDASWVEAASLFRAAVTRDSWPAMVKVARDPLGAVKSRTLDSAEYATSLPGAPDGHYVVIRFQTRFEHKARAVETITPMREADGKWRVSGYYVR